MESKNLITVNGHAHLSIAPDVILLELTIDKIFDSYETAYKTAETNIAHLHAQVEKCGLDKSLLKTTNFSIAKSYYSVFGNKQKLEGLKLSQNLQIEIEVDNELLTALVHGLGECLSDVELNITYAVKDPQQYKLKMLEYAVKDAKEKAQVMAAAAGCSLGQVESIDSQESNHFWYRAHRCALPQGMLGSKLDLNPVDIDENESVIVRWFLIEETKS